MEISGSFNVSVTGIQMKADKKNDGQEILVDCDLSLSPKDAEKHFGEAFHHVAFACMREVVEPHDDGDATVTRFGYSTKMPPKWLRSSVHNIDLWKTKQRGQPVIRKITAGEDLPQVTIALRFTFDANENAEIIGNLGVMVGKTAKIKLKPIQGAAFSDSPPVKKAPTAPVLAAVG